MEVISWPSKTKQHHFQIMVVHINTVNIGKTKSVCEAVSVFYIRKDGKTASQVASWQFKNVGIYKSAKIYHSFWDDQ